MFGKGVMLKLHWKLFTVALSVYVVSVRLYLPVCVCPDRVYICLCGCLCRRPLTTAMCRCVCAQTVCMLYVFVSVCVAGR